MGSSRCAVGMGCSSGHFVCAVVVHNLFLSVVMRRFKGVLQYTLCIWEVVVHILCTGCCGASVYVVCCSAHFV